MYHDGIQIRFLDKYITLLRIRHINIYLNICNSINSSNEIETGSPGGCRIRTECWTLYNTYNLI